MSRHRNIDLRRFGPGQRFSRLCSGDRAYLHGHLAGKGHSWIRLDRERYDFALYYITSKLRTSSYRGYIRTSVIYPYPNQRTFL